MPPSAARPTVISKSVSRAFALLELFRSERRALTAGAIEGALGIPQPSALVLARELAQLGYLSFDPATREYFPTERVLDLGAWLGKADLPRQRLRRLVDELARLAGETTTLCTAGGAFLEIDHVAVGTQSGSILMRPGRAAPLTRSGSGRAVLATFDDAEALARIAAAEASGQAGGIARSDVLRDLRSARRNGFLAITDLMTEGIGAVCFPLPVASAGGHFALVIGAPSPRIRARRDELVALARPLIEQRLPQARAASSSGGARRAS